LKASEDQKIAAFGSSYSDMRSSKELPKAAILAIGLTLKIKSVKRFSN
jgi:hypothetical protein